MFPIIHKVQTSTKATLAAVYYHNNRIRLKISLPIISISHLKQNQVTCTVLVPLLVASPTSKCGIKRRRKCPWKIAIVSPYA